MSNDTVDDEVKLFVAKLCLDVNNDVCKKLQELGVETLSDI